jgi:hypothetical protein
MTLRSMAKPCAIFVPEGAAFEGVELHYCPPGRPGRLSALSVLYSKSVMYVASVVWARRALNDPKRRFLARAVCLRGLGELPRLSELESAAYCTSNPWSNLPQRVICVFSNVI